MHANAYVFNMCVYKTHHRDTSAIDIYTHTADMHMHTYVHQYPYVRIYKSMHPYLARLPFSFPEFPRFCILLTQSVTVLGETNTSHVIAPIGAGATGCR